MKNSKTLLSLSLIIGLSASASAMAGDNTGVWTKEQVEKLCYGKANGNANTFDRCMGYNDRKVGNKKRPGEAAALDNVDDTFKQKATVNSPQTSTTKNIGNSSEQNKPKIF